MLLLAPLPAITLLLNQPLMHNPTLEQQLAFANPDTHLGRKP